MIENLHDYARFWSPDAYIKKTDLTSLKVAAKLTIAQTWKLPPSQVLEQCFSTEMADGL